MSELINNSQIRKQRLKELILKLHSGVNQEVVRQELIGSLSNIPYGEVVEVEQELINEGLPVEEVMELCDIHSAVLDGHVDGSAAKQVAAGHPVDIFQQENDALNELIISLKSIINELKSLTGDAFAAKLLKLRAGFNSLYDVDKHYLRKEYLLFPYLEKEGITGPPKVMWGKHDEARELIKGSIELLKEEFDTAEFAASTELLLLPALNIVYDMIGKEEEILLPMALDTLTEAEWYEISRQTLDFGYCLYDPPQEWKPEWAEEKHSVESKESGDFVQLPSGNLNVKELLAILNTLPLDMTFVDKDDKVKYFSQGKDRIFQRNRAILNRDVRLCHPPASSHIVDKIIDDFKSGQASHAPFWIRMGDKFIHIEYFALHDDKGQYLGVLEVSQDVEPHRRLEGEQRILSYSK
jgi:uncharacterized protein